MRGGTLDIAEGVGTAHKDHHGRGKQAGRRRTGPAFDCEKKKNFTHEEAGRGGKKCGSGAAGIARGNQQGSDKGTCPDDCMGGKDLRKQKEAAIMRKKSFASWEGGLIKRKRLVTMLDFEKTLSGPPGRDWEAGAFRSGGEAP